MLNLSTRESERGSGCNLQPSTFNLQPSARLFAIILIVATLFTVGLDAFSSPARANGCTGNVCASASGGVNATTEQPTASCATINTGGTGHKNIQQGCNNSNYVKWGYNDDNNVEEYLAEYGWTYRGTNDNYRYFTYGMTVNFQPMVNYMFISISDGTYDNCGGWVTGSGCNFDAWQDYLSEWQSPSAQMRNWVDNSQRPSIQAYRDLESPLQGITHCQGSKSGSITYNESASATVSGSADGTSTSAQIGASISTTQDYYADGLCNANSDGYSSYRNMNWSGFNTSDGYYHMTTSAQTFQYITAFAAPDASFGKTFLMNSNMMVNWEEQVIVGQDQYIAEPYDLFDDNGNQLPNGTYAQVTWHYRKPVKALCLEAMRMQGLALA